MSDPKDKESPSIPAHLRPLFSQNDREGGAADSVREVLGQTMEDLTTHRFGRALKLSKLAFNSGRRLLVDRAKESMRKTKDAQGPDGVALAATLVETLSQMRGVSMKLGQMLSYLDDTLPPEARKVLAVLQRDAPPMPWPRVEEALSRSFGRPALDVFTHIEPEPLAAASIGQVHRAMLPSGVEVAVKVQYPGIKDAMAADLKNARLLSLFQRMFFFSTDTKAIMAELEARFMDECDYHKEAAYQEAYRDRFVNHPYIVVPEVHHDYCTQEVLTTTYYQGQSYYQWLSQGPSEESKARVTRLLYRFYLGSFYLDGLFNCDPHPGNYLFLDDGKMVFLDYGCTRRFEAPRLRQWVDMCLAVFRDDQPEMERLACELDFIRPGTKYDKTAFRSLMRYLYEPYLTDGPFDFSRHAPEDTFRRMFLDNPNLFKLNMPADAVFLNRISFGLVSLISALGGQLNCRQYAQNYFQGIDPDWPEDPRRGSTPYGRVEIST